ncbi:MAG: hypothetical protein HKP57_11735 [Halobacteria archaeon]|nr:hypothetical protein [Halobacteria archaeon]
MNMMTDETFSIVATVMFVNCPFPTLGQDAVPTRNITIGPKSVTAVSVWPDRQGDTEDVVSGRVRTVTYIARIP